jgi:hypothetical protein
VKNDHFLFIYDLRNKAFSKSDYKVSKNTMISKVKIGKDAKELVVA